MGTVGSLCRTALLVAVVGLVSLVAGGPGAALPRAHATDLSFTTPAFVAAKDVIAPPGGGPSLGLPTPLPTAPATASPTAATTETTTVPVSPTPPPTVAATSSTTSTVSLVGVSIVKRQNGAEIPVTTVPLGTPIRLKVTVAVSEAVGSGVPISVTWQLGSTYTYSGTYTVSAGRSSVYDDLTIPLHGFSTGTYTFTGTVAYNGVTSQAAIPLTVVPPPPPPAHRVHYAHLQITVPAGWTIYNGRGATGVSATGKDSLIMFSPSRRAAVTVISGILDVVPTTAQLRAFPPTVLREEFGAVQKVKAVTFKRKIDGHDVFAAQGDIKVDTQVSTALAITIAKGRRFYAFTLVNLHKAASPDELQAGLTAVFGSTLD